MFIILAMFTALDTIMDTSSCGEVTTTMPSMEKTIHALRDAGLRDRVKVMVGGAPVTQKFADQIGADGYSENAGKAVAVARLFVHA